MKLSQLQAAQARVGTLTIGASGASHWRYCHFRRCTGYQVGGDTLTFEAETGVIPLAPTLVITLTADDLLTGRGNSDRGNYTLRLCDFETVCGVRSFSIDLSRDELDVTTLPVLPRHGSLR